MSVRDWTVMVYIAADNDLSEKAVKSLLQMRSVGSTDQVHLLAQVDLHQLGTHSQRYTIGKSGAWDEEKIPEMNSGAIKDFVDFIKWGCTEEHRAERYLIVVWAHANGIFDNPDNERLTVAPLVGSLSPGLSPFLNTIATTEIESPLSSPQVEEIGIDLDAGKSIREFSAGMDATSRDALTTRELGEALAQAQQQLDKKISIFGVDACLMGMVEVAQQINESASLMVASQQTIPDTSWPYHKILEKLVNEPTMDERRLATLIVDEYMKAYPPSPTHQVTLSACDLVKTDSLVNAIANLRKALAEMLPLPGLRDVLVRVRGQVQSFMIQDFVDLFDFCQLLLAALSHEDLKPVCVASSKVCEKAKNACKDVLNIISKDDNSGFVIASGNMFSPGGALHRARGISIYFPMIPPIYKNLLFSSKTGWNKFLRNYASALLQDDGAGDSLSFATATSGSGNGHNPNRRNDEMSSNPAPEVSPIPCLALFEGTTVEDPPNPPKQITSMSFVEMGANKKVKIPKGADLDVPGVGRVKAGGGVPVKLTSGLIVGEGSTASLPLSIGVPECTLREPSNDNAVTPLSDGARIVTAAGGPIVLVLEVLDFDIEDDA